MVFGFGRGKIEVALEKFNYTYGDTVKGTVKLKMKQPTDARELRVFLRGEQRTSSGGGVGIPVGPGTLRVGSGSGSRSRSSMQRIFDFKLPLDGEKTYTEGEYPFEIKIPADLKNRRPEGALGTAVDALNFLGGTVRRINWYLEANLDIPSGFDVSKKVQINIG